MTRERLRIRVGFMIGTHLVLGLAMAIPALAYPGRDWPRWVQVWFLGLACSEVLLLGIWTGFSKSVWWGRIIGLAVGTGWLLFLGLSADPHIQNVAPMLGLLGPPLLVVTGACVACKWLFVQIEQRSNWKPLPSSEEVQFTLKSIFGLMLVVSLLLALGRFV